MVIFIVRKLLVNENPTIEDFEAIDFSLYQSLERMKKMKQEDFQYSFEDETFTIISSSEKIVELIPNGSNVALTFENRFQYCDLVVQV